MFPIAEKTHISFITIAVQFFLNMCVQLSICDIYKMKTNTMKSISQDKIKENWPQKKKQGTDEKYF